MFENPRRGREARNFTTNVPKILDLKSSSEQIFSRKLSLGAPQSANNFSRAFYFRVFPLSESQASTLTKKDRGTGFSVLVRQKMERAPFLARFSHGNTFKLLRHGELQMSSPPSSISHRLFRCRCPNSKDVVASSPFFSCPAARAPRGACSPANK